MSCITDEAEAVYVAIHQGDSLQLAELDGAAGDVDVTGWAFLSEIRDGAELVVGELTVTITDAPAGLLELSLTPGESAALPVADYGWTLQAVDAEAGERTLIPEGHLRIREDVSP